MELRRPLLIVACCTLLAAGVQLIGAGVAPATSRMGVATPHGPGTLAVEATVARLVDGAILEPGTGSCAGLLQSRLPSGTCMQGVDTFPPPDPQTTTPPAIK